MNHYNLWRLRSALERCDKARATQHGWERLEELVETVREIVSEKAAELEDIGREVAPPQDGKTQGAQGLPDEAAHAAASSDIETALRNQVDGK